MPMPEAAVDEDYGSVFWQDDIGLAWEATVFRAVHREAVAEPMEHRTHGDFRFRVAATDPRHDLRAFLRSENISHLARVSGISVCPQMRTQDWLARIKDSQI